MANIGVPSDREDMKILKEKIHILTSVDNNDNVDELNNYNNVETGPISKFLDEINEDEMGDWNDGGDWNDVNFNVEEFVSQQGQKYNSDYDEKEPDSKKDVFDLLEEFLETDNNNEDIFHEIKCCADGQPLDRNVSFSRVKNKFAKLTKCKNFRK